MEGSTIAITLPPPPPFPPSALPLGVKLSRAKEDDPFPPLPPLETNMHLSINYKFYYSELIQMIRDTLE